VRHRFGLAVRRRFERERGKRGGGQRRVVTALASATGSALGTSQRVVVTDAKLLDRAIAAVQRVVGDIDAACSRFRDDSELSRLHAARGRATEISPLLTRALAVALRAARLSDGAVDPTVGSAVKHAGYPVDFP